MNRLALGTAQVGLDYGIANSSGRVSDPGLRELLAVAAEAGVDLLDTAAAYGDSEARLGEAGTGAFQVVTKLPGLPEGERDVAGWVQARVEGSLRRLGRERLYGLLLHRPGDLSMDRGEALASALAAVRSQGLAERVGVSIYDPEELPAALERLEIQLVQAPLNVVDRRLLTRGWLARLRGAGIEVHARSVFLQGLLLQAPEARPAAFARWNPLWEAWERWLAEAGVTALQACLGFVLSQPEVRYAVVGADRAAQLWEVAAAARQPSPVPPGSLAVEDPALVNPTRWSVA